MAQVHLGWAMAATGDPVLGVAAMRRGAELLSGDPSKK